MPNVGCSAPRTCRAQGAAPRPPAMLAARSLPGCQLAQVAAKVAPEAGSVKRQRRHSSSSCGMFRICGVLGGWWWGVVVGGGGGQFGLKTGGCHVVRSQALGGAGAQWFVSSCSAGWWAGTNPAINPCCPSPAVSGAHLPHCWLRRPHLEQHAQAGGALVSRRPISRAPAAGGATALWAAAGVGDWWRSFCLLGVALGNEACSLQRGAGVGG